MRRYLFFVLLSAIIFSCKSPVVSFTAINPDSLNRVDEPVILSRELIASLVGQIPENKIPILNVNGVMLPSQVNDLDKDGIWDELVFVCSIKPNDSLQINISFVKESKAPVYPIRTTIRFAAKENDIFNPITIADRYKGDDVTLTHKYFQAEGPIWENDKVAFRNYFDKRNGMDIFGKTVSRLISDSISRNGDYHKLLPWGMDILKVANSLGAGSIAIMIGDSLHRVGPLCDGSAEVICVGPIRSILRLTYNNIVVDSMKFSIVHDISMWAGAYAYESRVFLKGAEHGEQIVTGIVNMHSDSLIVVKSGSYNILATHAKQAFNGEYLGLALLVSNACFDTIYVAPETETDITQTYGALLKNTVDTPVDFTFVAAWELSNTSFASTSGFINLLKYYTQSKTNPIIINY